MDGDSHEPEAGVKLIEYAIPYEEEFKEWRTKGGNGMGSRSSRRTTQVAMSDTLSLNISVVDH